MYTEDLRIANEFDIPNLRLTLNTLLAKENYFATGDSDLHFQGIPVQDPTQIRAIILESPL